MSRRIARSLIGSPAEPEMILRRVVPAGPADVLAACTQPERLADWFGAVEGAPAEVGDPFTVRFGDAEAARGRVLACAQDGFGFSWTWQDEAQSYLSVRVRPAPADPHDADSAPHTELTVLHALAEPDHVAGYGGGWEQLLDSLADHLGEPGASASDPAADEAEVIERWRSMSARPLEIRWHVPATTDRVWNALTTGEGVRRWCRHHGQDVSIEADAAPGSGFRILAPSAGIVLEGVYLMVDAPRRLALTWRWQDGDGVTEDEAVDITLEEVEDGTILTVRHTGPWDDDASPSRYQEHWESALADLEEDLTGA